MRNADDRSDAREMVHLVPNASRPAPYRSFHGPVQERTTRNVQVVTFTALDEPELLHSAADWLTEHPQATLLAVNWMADNLADHDTTPAAVSAHRLDLTVALDTRP